MYGRCRRRATKARLRQLVVDILIALLERVDLIVKLLVDAELTTTAHYGSPEA